MKERYYNLDKHDVMLVVGILLVLFGSLLPSITIAQENISFLKENGPLIIILSAAMFLLFKLNYKQLLYIPSVLSLLIIFKFMMDNSGRLDQIRTMYNCFASYRYGLVVMILGNIFVILTISLGFLNIDKLKVKVEDLIGTLKEKQLEKKLNMTHETTKDGMIKFNKLTVLCGKPIQKIKDKTSDVMSKFKKKNELSISKFEEDKVQTYKTQEISTIDIQKWTQSDICCSNCGATVHTTSEYCFLCDCKIRLHQEVEKLS